MQEPGPSEPSPRRKRDVERADLHEFGPDEKRVIELREEQLVANKEPRDAGEIIVRTEVDTVPAQVEVDALREEVEVEHEPSGEVVSKRDEPREEDGTLIIPVYEEQLVVTKRLILRERLRVRRVGTTERRLFQDTVRRERLVVEDPQQTTRVHETYRTNEPASSDGSPSPAEHGNPEDASDGGFLTKLVTRALE